ncbi:hypothetical protein SAMN04488024_107134 [Pedobacter soli]|uniref:Uncharacterized protein n=2 Tax=Pedobacter soli TaxID=390242 RepID=A0A1G6WXM6_9SPHI|nr:hypothetical protein SAMN04488024_107134 [Pedobacter soli]
MQFCCNLKGEATYLQYMKRVLAVWLMILFVVTSFFQIFHHHHQDLPTHRNNNQTSVKKWVKSCEVCNYLAHHHAEAILTAYHLELAAQIKPSAPFAGRYYIGCYKFTLQGFTNKGPPAIIS